MRQELACFDLANRGPNQLAEFPPLLVADRGLQVLNLRNSLPNKGHYRGIGNPADPGIADQLRIESQQSIGLLGITCRGGLPFEQAALAIERPHRIDVRDKIVVLESDRTSLTCILS